MFKNRKFLLLIICVCSSISAFTQDLHFSQFYNAPLTINPANTGVFNGDLRAYTLYRMQWFTVTKPYKTFSLGVDAPLFKKGKRNEDFFSVGLNLNNDAQGIINYITNSINGSFSYTKYLGGSGYNDLTLGYQIGYSMIGANLSGLTWDSQYDPVGGTVNPPINGDNVLNTTGYVDMSVGILWNFLSSNTSRNELGFSYHHFTSPNISINGGIDNLHPKMSLQWNMAYQSGRKGYTTILPSLLVSKQGGVILLNAGANVRFMLQEPSRYTRHQSYKAVYLGGFYRLKDAAYLTFKFDYANYTLGIAYDINVSKLTPASKTVGAFEFMLQYKGTFGKYNRMRRFGERFLH